MAGEASEDTESHESPPSSTAIVIGKYTHSQHHRDGLFSFVYKARAPQEMTNSHGHTTHTNNLVALKVTTPSLMVKPHDSEREARILNTCHHPHIIPLLEPFWQAGGRFVLVFPFMANDFAGLLEKERLTESQIKSCLRDLFSGLSYLHSCGIIHRDVKPSNILLKTLNGPAYLADFGIAWSPDDYASEAPDAKITDVGTTCYRPPELLFGNTSYGNALDLWAAGCVVAEALSKPHRPLFEAGDLGSELALIQSIFKTLGTPTTESWPVSKTLNICTINTYSRQEAAGFRDWGKMAFYEYPARPWPKIMPNASDDARDLVSKLVQYESVLRIQATTALSHPSLKNI